jgi:excisionase family DNA binding protein
VTDHAPEKSAALLLTPKQTALALAMSPRTLWGLTANGEIPHLKIGRLVRYSVEELQRWIKTRRKGEPAR